MRLPLLPLTTVLTREHGLLLRALSLFARYGEQVTSGGEFDPRLARAFMRFFRDFGDHVHHEKEEQALFPWLEEQGLPADLGPLGVLRQEHDVGRELRLALSLAADGLERGPRDPEARRRFHELARRYVEWMTAHIDKEELVLYPLADSFAHQVGHGPEAPDAQPRAELRWLDAVEARAERWPDARLSLEGLGTPYAFERLCEAALARG